MNIIENWGLVLAGKVYFIAQAALFALFLYYIAIALFGLVRRKGIPAEKFPVVNRFALIVAAHNEETVIGNIVSNLKCLNYPRDMYDVFVIADNCTDNTAQIARSKGAIVHERFDSVRRGKGYSLQWMFDRLFKMDKKYDAVCIFDADNLVSRNFLLEMNKQLSLGHKVIQGYLDSKNPCDSWISCNYALAYWIANRLFQLPRHYLGLNCALGGTGFTVATDVLKKIGWDATCLTEDLEFSIKLVMNGLKVSWSHDAVVYDEKPLEIVQSWRQRTRWMQGHCDCAFRYFKTLMCKAFRDRDIVAFDCALYLIQPLVLVVGTFMSLTRFAGYLFGSSLKNLLTIDSSDILYIAAFLLMNYIGVVFVLMEGKLNATVFKYYLAAPVFGLTWIPIIIQGFFTRNNKEWVHTLHTRSIDISALEKTG